LDEDGKSILKAGHAETENSQYTFHDVKLESDEKMVGIKASKRGEAFMWDLQLVIGRNS
jgi:hypothetical protein